MGSDPITRTDGKTIGTTTKGKLTVGNGSAMVENRAIK